MKDGKLNGIYQLKWNEIQSDHFILITEGT